MTTQANAGASAPNSNPSKESTLQNKKQALAKFGIDINDVIHEQGRYWMTAKEIGIALGYRDPGNSMNRLCSRHKDELEPYKERAKLTDHIGIPHETSIFNTDGMWLIALLANTPKAKKFRKFIVNMLKALEREEFIHVSKIEHWSRQVEIWKEELIALKLGMYIYNSRVMSHKKYNKMVQYRKMGLTQRETAKLLDISRDIVQQCERIPRQYQVQSPIINHQSKKGAHSEWKRI